MKTLIVAAFRWALMFLVPALVYAGSGQWDLNPTSSDWNMAENWTPMTVPNGPADIATFALSNTTNVSISEDTEVSSIMFTSAATNAYAITVTPSFTLMISGVGISDSATTQHFVANGGEAVNGEFGSIRFSNNATAGGSATFTNNHGTNDFFGGVTLFSDTSTAGSATFINKNGTVGGDQFQGETVFIDNSTAGKGTFINNGSIISNVFNGGGTNFRDSSTAGNATITNNGGAVINSGGCIAFFANSSTAASATIINNGGTASGAFGGETIIGVFDSDTATAASATLIANGGTGGGRGGITSFFGNSTGGTSRIEVFGNGSLDLSGHNAPRLTVGSIEGDGDIFLGANNLTVGSNNLSTIFSGVIDGIGGSLTKIGTSALALTGENTYAGGTTIEGGRLWVNNMSGSGTGSGGVQVNAGTLGGRGTISGAVTVGTRSGAGAVLAPGRRGGRPGNPLTIQSTLTFNFDATYEVGLTSLHAVADKVLARGVRIRGAQIAFDDSASGVLPPGTAFTLIDNMATSPLSGTFSNLPDNSTVTVGNNTFQASYEGGDGNDLTLTVVP
jgi:autotransporter-associated beta strand protein